MHDDQEWPEEAGSPVTRRAHHGKEAPPEPSAEVAVRPTVPDHYTGEAIVLPDAAPETLAAWLDEARGIEGQIRAAKGMVNDELLARLDRRAKWTGVTFGDWEVTGDSPDLADYEIDTLKDELARLVAEGLIDQEAAEACIRTPEPKAEVAKRGITAVCKVSPEVKARVEACRRPARRRVKRIERVAGETG